MHELYIPFQPTLTRAGLSQLGLGLETARPCASLKGLVHAYLQIKAQRQTIYPVMPDGTQAIFISSHGSMVNGALTQVKEIPLLKPGEYFGIWFYPGALRHFFALNLSDISGQFVDEKYFQCNDFLRLHSELYEYKTFHDRANACERWVLERYFKKPTTRFDHALSIIYQSSGSERVRSVAEKIGWCSRHLNRQFLEHTGLGTKAFSQIIRAQALCRQLHVNSANFKPATAELGYYDQSHLIKALKKYFSFTPREFLNQYMSDFYKR